MTTGEDKSEQLSVAESKSVDDHSNSGGQGREERVVMYQTVAARRVAIESMLWQVPGLALTAQAFLMTIGLGPGTGQLARIASGLLSVVVSLMSVHLLMRHRRGELTDSVWLENFERSSGWEIIHDLPDRRAARLGVRTPRLARYPAYRIWIAGLCSFGIVGLAIALDALIG